MEIDKSWIKKSLSEIKIPGIFRMNFAFGAIDFRKKAIQEIEKTILEIQSDKKYDKTKPKSKLCRIEEGLLLALYQIKTLKNE